MEGTYLIRSSVDVSLVPKCSGLSSNFNLAFFNFSAKVKIRISLEETITSSICGQSNNCFNFMLNSPPSIPPNFLIFLSGIL